MEAISDTRRAQYIEGERIRMYFGRFRRVGGAEVLEMIAREGALAAIQKGGDLERELAKGGLRSAAKYRGKIPPKRKWKVPFAGL